MALGSFRQRTASKFRNVPRTIEFQGSRCSFQSGLEARRAQELDLMEKAGVISGLKRQPRYQIVVEGTDIGLYVADFTYYDNERKCEVVEECKGVWTELARWKVRLFEALYKTRVEVIR